MDIAEFLASLNVFDVLVVLFLFGMFVLGFIQGTIRRLVGIASMVFSFFLAAQLHIPLGAFLAEHWTQFASEYSYMLAFLIVFVAAVVAFSLVIQGTYKKAPLFRNYPVIDEVVGGVLGIVQGFLVLLFLTIILDQYFLYTNLPQDEDELGILRAVWEAIDTSGIGLLLHENVIPAFINVFSFLIPESVRVLYGIG